MTINLMVFPPVGVILWGLCDGRCVDRVSTFSLLFLFDERANALNHGPGLFFRELSFKAGHKFALSVFYRVGDLLVGVRFLPFGFSEVRLSHRSPVRQPRAILPVA